MIWAAEPWTGRIGVVDTVWSTAHTTQATRKGWRMLQKAGRFPDTSSGGSGYLPPAGGALPAPPAPPVSPVYPPAHCPPASFGSNASGLQCDGLGADGSAKSAPECAVNCCNDEFCAIWQFSAGGSSAGQGCWRGVSSTPLTKCRKDPKWTGGVRSNYNRKPIGTLPKAIGGSYVGYVSSDAPSADVSVVVETMGSNGSRCSYGNGGWADVPAAPNAVRFCLSADVCKFHKVMKVRYSAMQVAGGARFLPMADIVLPQTRTEGAADACCFDVTLLQGHVYTFTTLTTMNKGASDPSHGAHATAPELSPGTNCGPFAAPIVSPFPLPYATTFSQKQVRFGDFTEFLSDVKGVFRVTDGVLRQQMAYSARYRQEHSGYWAEGCADCQLQSPLAVIGSKLWTDYTVTATGKTEPADGASATISVLGRTGHGFAFGPAGGYELRLAPANDTWWLLSGPTHDHVLATGTAAKPERAGGDWRTLSLAMKGDAISASIDGTNIAIAHSSSSASGLAAISTSWHHANFSSLSIKPSSSIGIKSDDYERSFSAPVLIQGIAGKQQSADGFGAIDVYPTGKSTLLFGPDHWTSYDSGVSWSTEQKPAATKMLDLANSYDGQDSGGFLTASGGRHNLGSIMNCPPNGCWTGTDAVAAATARHCG